MDMTSTNIFFNHCFDKKRLKAFILWSYSHNGPATTVSIVEKMKEKGFSFATQAGISIGLDDLQRPPQKARFLSQAEYAVQSTARKCREGYVTDVERVQQVVDTWHRTSERLRQDVVDHFRATDILNPVYMMAFSGARGNISQVRQLTAMRGLMADPEGRIVGFPIRSSFREGLTLTEYMISCYGARKGLVDTALRTADAGYLTRRLVDVAHHVVVKGMTCGTRQGIFLKKIQSGKKTIVSLEERLAGRVLAADIPLPGEGFLGKRNQIISDNLAKKLAFHCKEVLVRSPLKCSLSEGVCQLCYGWNLSERKLVTVGDAVGIIAAQSIGEPGTQLTMRTFHTGGVFSGHLVEEVRAPHPGVIHFPRPLQGLLIRTSSGRVAFLVKVEGKCILEEVWKKRGLHERKGRSSRTNQTRLLMEASTVLFVRQGETVLQDHLLAQSPSMETETNTTVEGIRIIFAQLAGQVATTKSGVQLQGGEKKFYSRRPLKAIWILAGSRLPLADAWVKTRFTQSKLPLPSPSSKKADQHLQKSIRLLPFLGKSELPFLGEGRGELSIVTIYHLHREGGHLIDDRSLLGEVAYNNRSTTLFLEKGYTISPSAPTIGWHLSQPPAKLSLHSRSERNEGNSASPAPQRKFEGEILRQLVSREKLLCSRPEGTNAATFTARDQINLLTRGRRPIVYVGQFLYAGQEIASGLGAPISGQVIRVGREEVTLRRAETILAYARGQFYADGGQWIEGNTPIVALPYRQLLIDDIVQGIPKIEQLFEASKTKQGRPIKGGVQQRLTEFFKLYRYDSRHEYRRPLSEKDAARRSVEQIQEILVEAISKVYLSQGVVIADKHLEIIIRQMTSKVEITMPGNSSLFSGEYISFDIVEKINRSLPPKAEKAHYEPALYGITKTASRSDSFLSAASFQETTRVLIRHATEGRIDYLRGLKQHVIGGDLIPAGTGLDLYDGSALLVADLRPLSRWRGSIDQ